MDIKPAIQFEDGHAAHVLAQARQAVQGFSFAHAQKHIRQVLFEFPENGLTTERAV
jgi:hypothetical protein